MPSQAESQPTGNAPCPVCGSTNVRPWKTRKIKEHITPEDLRITDARYGLTLPLVKCGECGFRFADTVGVERLTSLYERLTDPEYEEGHSSRLLQMRWLISLAREAHPDAKTALDVGAASGLLVAETQRAGFNALGIEPSRSLVEAARRHHGVKILPGVLPHPDLEGMRFDVIFLVDVIEHVSDPIDLLQCCADRLADRGILLIVTPDVSSFAARAFGSRWWHCRLAHVGYFNQKSLERAFERVDLHAFQWLRAKWFFSVDYLASRLESYLPVAWFNRIARRIGPLRWLYARIIPLNLLDSYVVLVKRAR